MIRPQLSNRPARSRRPRVTWPGAAALLAVLALAATGCGGDIEARMAEVRALQDVGQFTASIEELREILAIAPDLPEASYRLGVALVQTGEPSRAIWPLEKASESPEYAIPASLLLASAHFASQNFDAVIDAAGRVLELDPDRHAALRMRAQGNLGAGHLDEALTDAERLLELFPEDYGVHALHATILTDMDRKEEARAANEELKAIALASGDPAIAHRGCLAPALYARDHGDDPVEAERLFDDCVERFPTNGFVAGEAMRFYDRIEKPEKAMELIRRAAEQAPENLSIRAQLATRLASAGQVDEAEKVLREAVDSFKSAGAWNLLANFYRQQGEPEKAIDAIEKVIETSGGGSDQLRFTQADVLIDVGELERAEEIAASLGEPVYARLLQGRILLERGDPDGALEMFEEGIRAWPNNAGARYLAGLAARQVGDSERAISELREAVRVDKTATPAAEVLMRVHFDRGDYEEAIQFGRVAQRRRGANLGDIYRVGVRALVELGQFEDARTTVDVLGKQEGYEKVAVIERAAVEREASGPAAAVQAIEKSGLDLSDRENEDVLRAWVAHQIAQEQTQAALRRVDQILATHPQAASLHELRGSVLVRLGRDDEARTAYEKTVAIDSEDAGGVAGLATLAARGNDLAKAVELYDRAAALAPEVSGYPYSAAQLTLAQGDVEGAEQRLRRIVRNHPGHAGSRNDLAWILAEKNADLDRALALAEEAQRLDPSPDVLDTLGWVRFKRGELSAAVAALEQAVEARGDSPSTRYRLGIALRQAGDAERAREMLRAAIDAGAFPEVDEARRELARIEGN